MVTHIGGGLLRAIYLEYDSILKILINYDMITGVESWGKAYTYSVLERIHADVVPNTPLTQDSCKYILTFIDDFITLLASLNIFD